MGKSCGLHDFFSFGGQYYSLGQSTGKTGLFLLFICQKYQKFCLRDFGKKWSFTILWKIINKILTKWITKASVDIEVMLKVARGCKKPEKSKVRSKFWPLCTYSTVFNERACSF